MQEELSPSVRMKALIEEHLPEYNRAFTEIRSELGAYGGRVHPFAHRSVSLLLVQTANDFIDLLDDIGWAAAVRR